MKKLKLAIIYASLDLLASGASWVLFVRFRNNLLSLNQDLIPAGDLTSGLFIIAPAWVLLYMLSGLYSVSLRRSRLIELAWSLAITAPGVFLFFFILQIKGYIPASARVFSLLLILFILQFFLTYIPRLIVTSITASKVHRGLLGFKTLIIGSGPVAQDLIKRIREEKVPSGNILSGYVNLSGEASDEIGGELKFLGKHDDLPAIISENNIEEVIIAIDGSEAEMTDRITALLSYTDVTVKAVPSLKDILTGRVVHNVIHGTPLLEVSNHVMPPWQANLKQLMDYTLALLLLVAMLPLIIVLAIIIRLSSKGPVIFSQERTGKNGKPFKIYKFRSMYPGAEKDVPLLSSSNDTRVTSFGRFMRRHRIDEIPNLLNVLRGEMSFVGPRPERQYFVDIISKKAPHYKRLLKVKPGITSWGQVKYGYAGDTEQMMERMQYDLLYLENMSLLIDLKIIIYTIIIILKGKGV